MVKITPLNRYNWEEVIDLKPHPEQEEFVPSVIYSLAQSKFEQLHPYGIIHDEQLVGYLMYGDFSDICWINRIMIDRTQQGKGIASEAVKLLLNQLKMKINCREIRTSYARNNYAAEALFTKLGFERVPSSMDQEIVARYMGE